jgi:hypothetical protein
MKEMALLFYAPLMLGVIGIVASIRASIKTRSVGYLPAGAAFCIPVVITVAQWVRVKQFVSVEIEPDVWTTSVVRTSLPELAILALLLISVLLLSRTKNQA